MADDSHRVCVQLRAVQYRWAARLAPVLDIPDFQVEKGEKVFVQGPSGSGKSTLLGILGGVLLPQTGDVHILGNRLNGMRGRRRDTFRATHIGFIFQMFNLLPYLSLVENVLLPCHFSRQRQRKAQHTPAICRRRRRVYSLIWAWMRPCTAMMPRSSAWVSNSASRWPAHSLVARNSSLPTSQPQPWMQMPKRDFSSCCFRSAVLLTFVSHNAALAEQFDRSVDLVEINRAG